MVYEGTILIFFCFFSKDDSNIYSCPKLKPRHFSIVFGRLGVFTDFSKLYGDLVGGVINYSPEHYRKLNGYPNVYWGWGAEDDDMTLRLKKTGLGFDRPLRNTNYTMLLHKARWKNPNRFDLLKDQALNKRTVYDDGLQNVKYTFKGMYQFLWHTHLYIDVGTPPPWARNTSFVDPSDDILGANPLEVTLNSSVTRKMPAKFQTF